MLDIGLGAGFIIIGFTAQFLLTKRVKHAKIGRVLSWIAWTCVAVGGEAVTTDIGTQLGVTGVGAAVASWVMVLFILVDVADRRPDWLAFILIGIAPSFMRMAGGWSGIIFDALLAPVDFAASLLGKFLGA